MGVIEAIKKGFGIATKNMLLVLVLFIFNLIWNLASIPFMQQAGTPEAPQFTPAMLILSVLFILISIFIQGGSIGLIRDFVKENKIKLGNFLSYGLKYYLRLFGLGLLIVLLIAIVALIATLIIIATTPLNNTAITVIAAIAAIIIGGIGLYYVLLLVMSPYTIVCNELGVIEAMKKSIAMVRRSLGKVVLLLLALVLISIGLGFIIGFATGLVTIAIPAVAGQILIGVINSAFNGYLGIVMIGSFIMFYFGLVEKEKSAEKVF